MGVRLGGFGERVDVIEDVGRLWDTEGISDPRWLMSVIIQDVVGFG